MKYKEYVNVGTFRIVTVVTKSYGKVKAIQTRLWKCGYTFLSNGSNHVDTFRSLTAVTKS